MKCLHIVPFWQDIIPLLTSSIASSEKPAVVEGAASAMFNFIKILLDERLPLREDDAIEIVASITQALRVYMEPEKVTKIARPTMKGFDRLLVVCIGGIIVLTQSNIDMIIDLLLCLDAKDLISKVGGTEMEDVLALIGD